ncbi:MAG: hypothetical protein E8D46_17870 [Nitrospira sp.]|nr:MAG: hypothetical protein E8D46_17870 [Nitrospira sp.]
MANYYTSFSTHIKYRNREEQLWLLAQLDAQDTSADDDGPYCNYEDDPKEQAVWVYTEESGNVDGVADLVARFQTRFTIPTPWILEWANTCSSPRLDSFSGGAMAVYKGNSHTIWPHGLAERWIKQQERKAQKTRTRALNVTPSPRNGP